MATNRSYANEELKKVVKLAKEMGLKVWTFESRGPIKQVFFDNGKTYGTASEWYGGLRYGTCHKACRQCGTGFSLGEGSESANKERIEQTFSHSPSWAISVDRRAVVKESFANHIKRETILKYYEL